jgi:hypothetical protein
MLARANIFRRLSILAFPGVGLDLLFALNGVVRSVRIECFGELVSKQFARPPGRRELTGTKCLRSL